MMKKFAAIAAVGATATVVGGTILAAQGDDQPSAQNASTVAGTSTQAKARGEGSPCTIKKWSQYKKFINTTQEWPNNSEYRVSGYGPNQQLNITVTAQRATSIQGSFGISPSIIVATIGGDVTVTHSVTKSFSANLPKKAHYSLRVGRFYKNYIFNAYERRGTIHWPNHKVYTCKWDGVPRHFLGTGKVKWFWTLDSKLVKV
ncbi:hypothetical protein FXF68_39215 [Actinomadura decatromicini]|uniref:Uncharacterized protein n=2 Tax=Actinomadura decatromicini TaxID=2604572 RepID=A0A5D3F2L9_9ACTN|nr:hypothetical protein FXF68_39215 [Actinomadura decatromicini]